MILDPWMITVTKTTLFDITPCLETVPLWAQKHHSIQTEATSSHILRIFLIQGTRKSVFSFLLHIHLDPHIFTHATHHVISVWESTPQNKPIKAIPEKRSVEPKDYFKRSRIDSGFDIVWAEVVIIINTYFTLVKPLLAAPCQAKAQEVTLLWHR